MEKAPMIVGTAPDRFEIRRLVHWFDERLASARRWPRCRASGWTQAVCPSPVSDCRRRFANR